MKRLVVLIVALAFLSAVVVLPSAPVFAADKDKKSKVGKKKKKTGDGPDFGDVGGFCPPGEDLADRAARRGERGF